MYRGLVSKTIPIYSFLFVFTVGFVVFVIPQLIIVYKKLPEEIKGQPLFYIMLCYLMVYIGSNIKISLRITNNPLERFFDIDSLAIYAIGFILISAIGFVSLSSSSTSSGSQWSGKDVMYNFFFTSYRFALIFSSVGFFKSRKKIFKILIFISTLFFIDRVLISGRRTDMVYYAIAIGVPYLYYTGAKLKMWFCLPAVLLAFQALSLLVALRTVTLEGKGFGSVLAGNRLPSISEVLDAKEILDKKEKDRAPELTAYCYGFRAVNMSSSHNYGAGYWNAIVQDFVPAQIVGSNMKKSLMFKTSNITINDYKVFTGSTMTGFYDSFAAFSYAGCLFFLVMGFVMTKISNRAFEGDVFCMIFYLCVIVDALHAVTHRSSLFLCGIIYFIIYLLMFRVLISAISLIPHVRNLKFEIE